MKILVTGATGFLGRNVMDFLAGVPEPLALYALVRDPEKASVFAGLSKPVTVIHGDLRVPQTLAALPSDLDWVFHVAALVGLKDGPAFYEVNREGTRNLLAALQSQQQLKRLVYISSIAAVDRPMEAKPPYPPLTEADVPHPRTDYGQSKLQAEQLIQESGLPFTILRPAYIYGPYPRAGSTMDRAIRDTWAGNPYTRIPYTGHASELYAVDLAEMMWQVARASQCQNQVYFAANREPQSVQQFFRFLCELQGVRYQPWPLPRFLLPWLKRTMIKEGLEALVAEILFHDYFVCDTRKLYSHLSWRPYYGFGAGLTRTIQWYRQAGLLQ